MTKSYVRFLRFLINDTMDNSTLYIVVEGDLKGNKNFFEKEDISIIYNNEKIEILDFELKLKSEDPNTNIDFDPKNKNRHEYIVSLKKAIPNEAKFEFNISNKHADFDILTYPKDIEESDISYANYLKRDRIDHLPFIYKMPSLEVFTDNEKKYYTPEIKINGTKFVTLNYKHPVNIKENRFGDPDLISGFVFLPKYGDTDNIIPNDKTITIRGEKTRWYLSDNLKSINIESFDYPVLIGNDVDKVCCNLTINAAQASSNALVTDYSPTKNDGVTIIGKNLPEDYAENCLERSGFKSPYSSKTKVEKIVIKNNKEIHVTFNNPVLTETKDSEGKEIVFKFDDVSNVEFEPVKRDVTNAPNVLVYKLKTPLGGSHNVTISDYEDGNGDLGEEFKTSLLLDPPSLIKAEAKLDDNEKYTLVELTFNTAMSNKNGEFNNINNFSITNPNSNDPKKEFYTIVESKESDKPKNGTKVTIKLQEELIPGEYKAWANNLISLKNQVPIDETKNTQLFSVPPNQKPIIKDIIALYDKDQKLDKLNFLEKTQVEKASESFSIPKLVVIYDREMASIEDISSDPDFDSSYGAADFSGNYTPKVSYHNYPKITSIDTLDALLNLSTNHSHFRMNLEKDWSNIPFEQFGLKAGFSYAEKEGIITRPIFDSTRKYYVDFSEFKPITKYAVKFNLCEDGKMFILSGNTIKFVYSELLNSTKESDKVNYNKFLKVDADNLEFSFEDSEERYNPSSAVIGKDGKSITFKFIENIFLNNNSSFIRIFKKTNDAILDIFNEEVFVSPNGCSITLDPSLIKPQVIAGSILGIGDDILNLAGFTLPEDKTFIKLALVFNKELKLTNNYDFLIADQLKNATSVMPNFNFVEAKLPKETRILYQGIDEENKFPFKEEYINSSLNRKVIELIGTIDKSINSSNSNFRVKTNLDQLQISTTDDSNQKIEPFNISIQNFHPIDFKSTFKLNSDVIDLSIQGGFNSELSREMFGILLEELGVNNLPDLNEANFNLNLTINEPTIYDSNDTELSGEILENSLIKFKFKLTADNIAIGTLIFDFYTKEKKQDSELKAIFNNDKEIVLSFSKDNKSLMINLNSFINLEEAKKDLYLNTAFAIFKPTPYILMAANKSCFINANYSPLASKIEME